MKELHLSKQTAVSSTTNWSVAKPHRKQRGFWKSVENQRNFFEQIATQRGFRTHEDWYQLTSKGRVIFTSFTYN